MEAHSETVSSARERARRLLSSSEEEGSASLDRDDAVDLPPQSVLFEELLEVVTRAVATLNIEWPAERTCQECPKTSQCPLWFSLTHPAPLGLGAMV